MKAPGLLCAALLACAGAAQGQTLQIDSGQLDGVTLPSGVRAWLGIPFAAPPVRELRWRPPQPVARWNGVLHADRNAPMCLQTLRTRTMNHYFGNEAISEDCLYLSVWAPGNGSSPPARLPVIVWIYGGGFNVGSASMANYSGEGLARQGVVRVNLAYRLGALGFLAHPDLSKESGYGASGNYGIMDLIAGLQWVQRNIAVFGGDPANVTIAGQSAGSTAVALLQASPQAHGLFHRAVGMSGSPYGEPGGPVPQAQGEREGLALQQALGGKSIEDLRDMGGDRIIAAQVPRAAIVIDGHYVIGGPEAFAAKRQSDVPVMLGFTRDESFRPMGPVASPSELQASVRRNFPANADAILKAYPATDSASATRAATDIGRDASLGRSMANWASTQARHGKAPVYAYFFARRQPYTPGITFIDHDPATVGAYHSGEIPYFLRTRDSLNLFRNTRTWEPVDAALEEDMSGLLLSFAREGRPSSRRVQAWPVFTPDRPKMLRLGEGIEVIDWPHFDSLQLLAAPAAADVGPVPGNRPRD